VVLWPPLQTSLVKQFVNPADGLGCGGTPPWRSRGINTKALSR
jgi:hypothetical protein